MFNLMSLSDTLWLAYIVEIQTSTNHSISKLVQRRMWTPSRQSILRGVPQWTSIFPRRLSCKPHFHFSRIWISHMKKSRMLLIYDKKCWNYWNVHQKKYHTHKKKKTWKNFLIFFQPKMFRSKFEPNFFYVLTKPNTVIIYSSVIWNKSFQILKITVYFLCININFWLGSYRLCFFFWKNFEFTISYQESFRRWPYFRF